MQQRMHRRQFLGRAAAAGAVTYGYFVSGLPAAASKSPNERLNIAAIGVGNKGWHNVEQLTDENFVAFCDIDERILARASEQISGARQYRDYRKMLEAEHKNIDAVVVSTADHTHAPATSIALDLGKHVYCEKPLTHTVQEARVIAELARKHQVATQMGTQIHAGDNYRRVVEIVRSGTLGSIREVYCWCNKGWSNGRFESWSGPVPAHVDWDLWLGPAQERPYSPNVHPGNWRRFWEYGAGTFGDMGCHVMDLPFWALELTSPQAVVCEGPEVHPVGTPEWVQATYEFTGPDGQPLKLHWADGGANFDLVNNTRDQAGQPLSSWGLGILFVGERGMLVADYNQRQLLPAEKAGEFELPTKSIPDSIGHWREWTQACKTGSATLCNFDYASRLTEAVLLGIVAYRSGERIEWDAENLQVRNSSAAQQLISKPYRKGFEVVGIV